MDSISLSVLRRYFFAAGALSLVWEAIQLPLFTIWKEGTPGEITFAVAHCTAGDLLIASATLISALLIAGNGWPDQAYKRTAIIAISLGLAYTTFSEWRNVEILRSWTYSAWMPLIPGLPVGLSPMLQWIIVPAVAFWWANRSN